MNGSSSAVNENDILKNNIRSGSRRQMGDLFNVGDPMIEGGNGLKWKEVLTKHAFKQKNREVDNNIVSVEENKKDNRSFR